MVEVGTEPTGSTDEAMTPDDADSVLGGLFRSHYEQLVGLARLLVDERGQAEEVVQEAFARAYASWARVRDHDNPLPYLRTSVVNLARGGLRRRRTMRRTRLVPVPDTASAESAAAVRERERTVAEAVRTLPRRQRECVVLRYYLECSTAETATTLRIGEGSVKQHLHRALSTLGTTLQAEDES